MNEVLENIVTRRSVRSFEQGKKIEKNVLEDIVTAGLFAPSALNRQPVCLTVVADEKIIRKLSLAVGKAMLRDEKYDFYSPAAIIITSCERESKFVKEDTACALENMFLYAHSVGIGSVWIHQLVQTCDNPEVREILCSLGVPSDHVCGGMAALGYPAELPEKDLTRKGKVNYIL